MKKIVFTPEEVELLRREEVEARARWTAADIYPKKLYEEQRAEIVQEYARGADPCSSEKQQAWLRRIKKELAVMRREKAPIRSTI